MLALIYEALKKTTDWEKRFVLFFENCSDDTYDKCYNEMEKIVKGYFDVIYSSWQTSSDKDDYNTYLTNPRAFPDIKQRRAKRIQTLASKTEKVLSKYLI